jgi:tetraacyldisaccharide 4'-kinase
MRVAIVSRGYGSADGAQNDEAMVLEENLPDVPHLQDPDRYAAVERAVEELESELVVLDDGFQHRRLFRNLDIVLIDATQPPMNDRLFPRGTLREPVASLRRAGAVVLTRCDQVPQDEVKTLRSWIGARWPNLPIAATEHRATGLTGCSGEAAGLETLCDRPVAGFCGIGNPAAFRTTLATERANVVAFRSYPDHHRYTRADVADLIQWAKSLSPEAVIATTQKDWVKLRVAELAGRPLWAVRIGLVFRDGEAGFAAALDRVCPEN